MNDSYLITMNNLAIMSVSEISENLYLLSSFIKVKSFLVVTHVMTVPVNATCRYRPYKGVTPTANLEKKYNRDSNPPVLAGNLSFLANISGFPFSLNILPVFETLPFFV